MHSAEYTYAETLPEEAVRILIVVNNEENALELMHFLEGEDYLFENAFNESEALARFHTFKPNLILLDMSGSINAFETAKIITNLAGDRFIPVLFLSEIDSHELQRICLDAGGVDIIKKPYSEAVLKSKIRTFVSLVKLDKQSQVQKQELDVHNKQLKSNYDVAIDVFEKVIHSEVLDLPGIRYSISPISIFNGDILLAAYRPSGELQVMLGDFTGHGLSAAIGTIPVADIFYGMTAKGYGISDIIIEINSKLRKILPRGLFFAACLFEYDLESKKLSVWNAGLPDVLIFDTADKEVKYQFKSRNYPMGVSDTIDYSTTVENYYVKISDHLVLYTDGIIEARNEDGQLYGVENVIDGITNSNSEWVIDQLLINHQNFTRGKQQSDDTTLIELYFKCLQPPTVQKDNVKSCTHIFNSDWKLDFSFQPEILKVFDPIPNMIHMLMEIQKLHCHKQNIFIILKELFVNALDHGLLGLSSNLKDGADGFSKYIMERQKRLSELSEGEITVTLQHTGNDTGGVLDVYIKDTGDGFDTSLVSALSAGGGQYHSRGIFMVRSICHTLNYNELGNQVHASYSWATKPE